MPEFVFPDRIQLRVFEQLAGFSEVVEELIPESPATNCRADRGHSSLAGCGGACLHCMTAGRWQENESEDCKSAEYEVLHSRR